MLWCRVMRDSADLTRASGVDWRVGKAYIEVIFE
jgi:hypothetical protein